jgi:hypothetical protein
MRIFYYCSTLTILMISCGPKSLPRTRDLSGEVAGIVVDHRGRPVPATNVVATREDTHEEVAISRTREDGTFVLAIGKANVRLTTTTATEWGDIEHVHAGLDRVRFSLVTDCEPTRGRIKFEGGSPRALALLRVMSFEQKLISNISLDPDKDGSFSLCLPASEYFLKEGEHLAPRNVIFSVPAPAMLQLDLSSKELSESTPGTPLGVPELSRTDFSSTLPSSVRVLGLGESNHGSHEFTKERTALAIDLARANKLDLVLIEAGYGECLALDEYIKGSRLDIDSIMASLHYWIWDTSSLLEAIEAFRDYNKLAANKISLAGFDIQLTHGSRKYFDIAMAYRMYHLLFSRAWTPTKGRCGTRRTTMSGPQFVLSSSRSQPGPRWGDSRRLRTGARSLRVRCSSVLI